MQQVFMRLALGRSIKLCVERGGKKESREEMRWLSQNQDLLQKITLCKPDAAAHPISPLEYLVLTGRPTRLSSCRCAFSDPSVLFWVHPIQLHGTARYACRPRGRPQGGRSRHLWQSHELVASGIGIPSGMAPKPFQDSEGFACRRVPCALRAGHRPCPVVHATGGPFRLLWWLRTTMAKPFRANQVLSESGHGGRRGVVKTREVEVP